MTRTEEEAAVSAAVAKFDDTTLLGPLPAPYRTPAPSTETTADIIARVRARFAEVEAELREMNAPNIEVGWFINLHWYAATKPAYSRGALYVEYRVWLAQDPEMLCRAVALLPGLLRKARKACAKRDARILKARDELDKTAARAAKGLS